MDHPPLRPETPSITRPQSPAPVRVPDPGTPRGAMIGGLLAIALIVLVFVIQQSGWSAVKAAAAPPPAPGAISEPSVMLEAMARLYVRLNSTATTGGSPTPAIAEASVPALEDLAQTPADKVRVAIFEAELGKPELAVQRLEGVQASLPTDSPLAEDIADLIVLYRPPAEGEPAGFLDRADADRLEANHGWFGKLAAVYGKPATDPARMATVGRGEALVLFLAAFGLTLLLALLAGSALLVTGIVMAATGRLKTWFVPPAPGGSVAIETVAVFVTGFILLKIASEIISDRMADPEKALVFVLSAQWVLALVILWPVVRGVPAAKGLALLGLHKGQGVFREIGCGVLGYLACLPMFVIGALISVVLMMILALVEEAMGRKAEPVENEIINLVGRQGHGPVVALLFLLASLWAPLVEESIFRGALYRQLRTRWRWFGAAAVTALAFGAMHGYALPLLFPILALGFGFAMLREWRGSIIASMTAHCIHNAVALSLMVVVMRLLGM